MQASSFRDCKFWAEKLNKIYNIDYSKAPIEVLLNGICDGMDENDQTKLQCFLAGTILRNWKAWVRYKETSRAIDNDLDFFSMDWGYKAIMLACQYRAWRNPDKKVNASQALNQAISTVRKRELYLTNLDKNKANYNPLYTDDQISEEGHSSFLDTMSDSIISGTAGDAERSAAGARQNIQICVDNKKLVEAIILDTIAFNNVEKVIKEKKTVVDEDGNTKTEITRRTEFWPFRCVQLLEDLPADYEKYFIASYFDVKPAELSAAMKAIRSAKRQKLRKYITNTLLTARTLLED